MPTAPSETCHKDDVRGAGDIGNKYEAEERFGPFRVVITMRFSFETPLYPEDAFEQDRREIA
ncbi:1309_t:CDS:2 [Funneliformis caledonium]|uniref:1309_t:CDS:1 n=1 Tax=Funneliformis caledonium TaxID=1117310 RepID=A0A9N9A2W0_9GLOM|nr:1309_t:CDS:2 [Funneliformis caledonium]